MERSEETVDFPVAIEPVRPMSSIFGIAVCFPELVDRLKSIRFEDSERRFSRRYGQPQLPRK